MASAIMELFPQEEGNITLTKEMMFTELRLADIQVLGDKRLVNGFQINKVGGSTRMENIIGISPHLLAFTRYGYISEIFFY